MNYLKGLLKVMRIPMGYYIVALLLFIILLIVLKNWCISFLGSYGFLVLAKTLIHRTPTQSSSYNLNLFWSYLQWRSEWWQIVSNILMFIPIGLVGAEWKGRKGLLYAVLFSILIEILQFITHRGLFELDDIFNNTLGSLIGFSLYLVIKKIRRS